MCLRILLGRYRDQTPESRAISRGPAALVAAGVVFGAVLIGLAAFRG
jgi:D-galactosaminyltransferase